jgi:hypothetical protein
VREKNRDAHGPGDAAFVAPGPILAGVFALHAAAVAHFPFSLPLPGARRSRAPVLSVLLPGATRAASEDGGRIRPHVLASDRAHAGVPGLQLRQLAPGALAERSEALVRRLRLRKGRVSEAKAARGPPRREATREMKSTGSDHRSGIGQRPATSRSGMRSRVPDGRSKEGPAGTRGAERPAHLPRTAEARRGRSLRISGDSALAVVVLYFNAFRPIAAPPRSARA